MGNKFEQYTQEELSAVQKFIADIYTDYFNDVKIDIDYFAEADKKAFNESHKRICEMLHLAETGK